MMGITTRAEAETGTGTGAGMGTGAEMGTGTITETGGGGGPLDSATSGKKKQIRRAGIAIPHTPLSILYTLYNADRRGRLQLTSSFGRKARRLSDDVVPRGEPGPRVEREETVAGTEAGAGEDGNQDEDEDGNRHEDRDMGAGTGAGTGTGTRMEMRGEGGESPGTYEVVLEEAGGRRERRGDANNE